MKFVIALLMAGSLYAGQSLTNAISASIPQLSTTSPHRLEWAMHDWSKTGTGYPARVNAASIGCYLTSGNFTCDPTQVNSGSAMQINLNSQPTTTVYGRYQFCPGGLPGGTAEPTISLELWDVSGNRIGAVTRTYTTVTTANWTTGIFFHNTGLAAGAVAFARIHSVCLPLNSRTPTTVSNADRLYEWKLDGNGTAAIGGVNAGAGGTYTDTPNQGSYPVIRIAPTSWINWTSMRVGVQNILDGSASYSQSDATDTTTCQWAITSAPASAVGRQWISNRNSCTARFVPTVFGTYTFSLSASGSAPVTQSIGAVETDDKGVVKLSADAAKFFGPMMHYGRSKWQYMDKLNYDSFVARSAAHLAEIPAPWEAWKTGTISYTRQSVSTTTTTSYTATATSIVVADASQFNTSTLPIVLSTDKFSGGEHIRICSVSINTLTVCAGGRGWNNTTAGALASGARLHQMQVVGNSTTFLTDVCPAGIGPAGAIEYTAGTISLTPNSTSVSITPASGGNWTNLGGRILRVEGTISGQPFVFAATLNSGNSSGGTLNRPFPASAAALTDVSYHLLSADRWIALEWTHPGGIPTGGSSALQSSTIGLYVSGCESDTRLSVRGYTEAIPTGSESNVKYSVGRGTWFADTGINFYDEPLAFYGDYFRSGDESRRTAARYLSTRWLWHPLLAGGYGALDAREASITGAVANLVLDPGTQSTNAWAIVRRLASIGANHASVGCNADLRENAYRQSWLALAAAFDPVGANRTTFAAQVAANYTRDNSCKGADNSHPQEYFQDSSIPGLSVTNGSATVTASFSTPFVSGTSGTCPELSFGVLSLVNGSTTATHSSGATFASGGAILVIWNGRPDGQPFHSNYTFVSSTQLTLAEPWANGSGTYTYQILPPANNSTYFRNFRTISVASGLNDPNFGPIYACRFVSTTQITLDRPYAGATVAATSASTGMRLGVNNLMGPGTQPFIAGIKAFALDLSTYTTDSTTNANYAVLRNALSAWAISARDEPINGFPYGRGMPQCEPPTQRTSGCYYSTLDATAIKTGRVLGAEVARAMRWWYEAAPTPENRAIGDTLYAGMWSKPGFDAADVPSDPLGAADYQNVTTYKWNGFYWGMGAAYQWPAVREGGLASPSTQTLRIAYTAPAGATLAQLEYRDTDGTITTITGSGGVFAVPVAYGYGLGSFRTVYGTTGNMQCSGSSNRALACGEFLPLSVR